jgi:hypothetical protein
VAGLVLFLGAFSFAQVPGKDDPLASVSMSDLEKQVGPARRKCNDLFKGKEALEPSDEQQRAIDALARYTLYRFHDVKANEPGYVDGVFQEFEDQQLKPILENKDKNAGVPQLFTARMIAHAKLVLQTPRPKFNAAAINAARVLARLAKLSQPELADALLDILKDELAFDATAGDLRRNDGVKLYVLRGLGEMLALQSQNPPVLKPGQDAKIIDALTKFIERKAAGDKNAPLEEVDGCRALRREAVHALARARVLPQQSVLALLRVMARDGYTPEPRMDERLEAAIGVLRVSTDADKTYQPEYAAYQVALFVDALGSSMVKLKEEQKPLKVWGNRLMDGLEMMKADATKANAKNNAAAVTILDQCIKLLHELEDKGTLNPEAVVALDTWLRSHPCAVESLYKGVKEATVKPANRADDEPPDK